MQNVIKHSKYHYDRRRHTDAGEHAFSILAAKNELESQSTNLEFQLPRKASGHDFQFNVANDNPSLFKRLFRSKSYKKPNYLDSFPSEQPGLIGSDIRSIFLLFNNRLEEVSLPVQPTIDWLVLSFKLIFEIDFQIGEDTKLSFVIKEPNSDFFDPLLQFQKISSRSIISICNYPASHISNFPKSQGLNFSSVNQKSLQHSCSRDIAPKLPLRNDLSLVLTDISSIRRELRSLHSISFEFKLDFEFSLKEFSRLLYRECNLLCDVFSPPSDVPFFRHERMKLHGGESQYLFQSSEIYTELDLLELSIENIRLDVSKRGCRIVFDEIEMLNTSVSDIATILLHLRRQFLELEPKLKEVMALELEVIVKEEEFVKNEGFRLEESIFKCRQLNNILIALRKLRNISNVRKLAPLDILVEQFVTSEMHEALMNEIKNSTIDHITRVRSIELSSKLYNRRKILNYDPMKAFTKDLQIQKGFLRKTNNLSIISNRSNLNYHKLLEDYKREKFIQRSNRNMISHSIISSPAFDNSISKFRCSSKDEKVSRMTRGRCNLRLETSEIIPSNSISSDVYNPGPLYLQSKKNYYPQFFDNHGHDGFYSGSQINVTPSVPGPTNISNRSFKYYTRPQEAFGTLIRPNLPAFQQYSLV